MWQQIIEVIISKSEIILQTLNNHLLNDSEVKTYHFSKDYAQGIGSLAKINLLIIDDDIPLNIQLAHTKAIINFTDLKYTSHDILLKKPCKLTELLQIIKTSRDKRQIFCKLNHSWLYDEEAGKLYNQTTTIRFTERENKVFKCLLLAADNKISRGDLYSNVWQYHHESNSSAIETYMSRFKQKLPQNFIQLKSGYYKLINIDLNEQQ